MTVYAADMLSRLDWAKCSGEVFADVTVPAQTQTRDRYARTTFAKVGSAAHRFAIAREDIRA